MPLLLEFLGELPVWEQATLDATQLQNHFFIIFNIINIYYILFFIIILYPQS